MYSSSLFHSDVIAKGMAMEPENIVAETLVPLNCSKVDFKAVLLLYDCTLKPVLRLHCFSFTKYLGAFEWQDWNRLFGFREHVTMMCSAWSPKLLTPLASSEHISGGDHDLFSSQGLLSHRVYDQQLWSDHPAFPILVDVEDIMEQSTCGKDDLH